MQSAVKLHIVCMLKHGHSDKLDKGQCQIVSWLRQVKVGKPLDYINGPHERLLPLGL